MKTKGVLVTKINNRKAVKYFTTCILLLFATSGFAHSNIKEENYNSINLLFNPLFLAMLTVVVLLAVIIAVLADVLKNVASATKDKIKYDKHHNRNKIIGSIFILCLFANKTSSAQNVFYTSDVHSNFGGLSSGIFFFTLALILFELIVVAVLISSIKLLAYSEREVVEIIEEEFSFLEKLNSSIAIEKEEEIMFDHEYDGIRELDNDLPPWWKYGFYMTIVFAFVYLVHYHVTATGDLQLAEYNKSMTAAHDAKEAYQKTMANSVTEENVQMIIDVHQLAEASNIFKENCAACHGQLGEGGIGPNLTDNYWLHGGSLKDVFTTIKYGWPDKGMKSWQADLTPVKINELASYIKTLSGTNPAGQKEAQGELYSEKSTGINSTLNDSVGVVKIDSVKNLNK
ncbi:hypothetical protein BH10BAC1_BH10BAC1_16500 [soil metagenome]